VNGLGTRDSGLGTRTRGGVTSLWHCELTSQQVGEARARLLKALGDFVAHVVLIRLRERAGLLELDAGPRTADDAPNAILRGRVVKM
jgi:hypothetical protein